MVGIELFSGSGTFTNKCKDYGVKCISVDIRKRKGVCEPDINRDILKLTTAHLIEFIGTDKIDFIYAAPPCDIWSNASGGYHLDKNYQPLTKKCLVHIKILKKCLDIISEINPSYFFIENPRGKLRYYPKMIDFLIKNNGMIKELTLSSYGFPTTKPTNIFTNMHKLQFKELDSFGRGAKCSQVFNNLTKNQRQSMPKEFATTIIEQLLSS